MRRCAPSAGYRKGATGAEACQRAAGSDRVPPVTIRLCPPKPAAAGMWLESMVFETRAADTQSALDLTRGWPRQGAGAAITRTAGDPHPFAERQKRA